MIRLRWLKSGGISGLSWSFHISNTYFPSLRLNVLTKLLLEFTDESSLLHSFLNEKTRELTIIRTESGDPQTLQVSRQKAKVNYTDYSVIHFFAQISNRKIVAGSVSCFETKKLFLLNLSNI